MKRFSVAVALATIVLAGCKPRNVGALPPPSLIIAQELTPKADSACFGFAWTLVRDSISTAEGYLVVVTDEDGRDFMHRAKSNTTYQCVPPVTGKDTVRYTVSIASERFGTTGESSLLEFRWVRGVGPLTPPDSIVVGDSIPTPPNSEPTGLFATARALSPHFNFISRTFTDFCYCLKDTAAYMRAGAKYDLEMSGDQAMWKLADSTSNRLRYALLLSTLDEANGDPNSITGKYQADMRAWYKEHPEYRYESAFLHDTASGTPADSAHRLNPYIWSTKRFFLNPMDPGAIAYTVSRIKRSMDKPGVNGIFLDEMDGPNLGWIGKSRELRGADWQTAVVVLTKTVREAIAPGMLQTNAAGYSNRDFEKRIGKAAGSMHLELMNLATQSAPDKWSLIDELLGDSVYVDYVGAETWTDMLNPKFNTRYPGGNSLLPVYRAKVQQLANYYMVVPANPQRIGLQIDNVRAPVTPDSVDLPIYYLDVGHPTGDRSIWLDTRDNLAQRARVYRRDFTKAIVLNRPVTYWADTVLDTRSAVSVPLPAGKWAKVGPLGTVAPVDTLSLMLGESVLLVAKP